MSKRKTIAALLFLLFIINFPIIVITLDVEASVKDLNKPEIGQTNSNGRTDDVDDEDEVVDDVDDEDEVVDDETSKKQKIHPKKSFTITISPDKPTYSPSEIVYLTGSIIDSGKAQPTNGTVSIQVLNPNGTTIHIASKTTNSFGKYSDNFTLTEEATSGTYTVFVTLSLLDQDSYNHATFTVGESLTPSIRIASLYITDQSTENRSSFNPGETVIVWVLVQNGGAELEKGMIWVEVSTPDGVPIPPVFVETKIKRGEMVTVGVSTSLSDEADLGQYTANSYVSNKMISQGGKFLTKAKTIFELY
ncbi:MG2 domain-containing protein [[Eubacterium] cellulosolvens]